MKISYPKPNSIYFGEQKIWLAQSMLGYMLESGAVGTPGIFLDQDDLSSAVEEAYRCKSPPKTKLPTKKDADPKMIKEMAADSKVGYLIRYSDDDDALCLLGHNGIYYAIDLTAELFCQTEEPLVTLDRHLAAQKGKIVDVTLFTVEEEKEGDDPKKKKRQKKEK